jgi:DNA polymerase III alpha subunit
MGDFPDVDVDYLPPVRDYLKNVWAPQAFGAENVCSIGNYGTFGLKSSLIDMTRVHGYDRNEILQITTAMGLKDDDGQALTLDKELFVIIILML